MYVYPVSSAQVNCNGTVTALTFCFSIDFDNYTRLLGTQQTILTFSTMEQISNTEDWQIINRIEVHSTILDTICICSTMFDAICISMQCCDTMLLNPIHYFTFPSPNFAYSVTVFHGTPIHILTVSDLEIPQYTTNSSVPPIGDVIRLSRFLLYNSSVIILSLHISIST